MILMGQLAFLINDNRFGLHVVTQNMFSGKYVPTDTDYTLKKA